MTNKELKQIEKDALEEYKENLDTDLEGEAPKEEKEGGNKSE